MEAHLYEEWKGKSSLALKGRFFLFIILLFSCYTSLYGIESSPPTENNPEKVSEEIPEQKQPVKIYVTGGAEISFTDDAFISPILIIKNHHKHTFSKQKRKNSKKIDKKREKTVQQVVRPSAIFFSEEHSGGQFLSLNESLGKGIISSHQNIVVAILRLFFLYLILFFTLYLIFYENENILFRRILGRNFQRPPPNWF